MTQPAPTTYDDGDVRIEPGGRAIAVRQINQPNAWAIISADQGLRIASRWEVDVVQSWEPMARAKTTKSAK
ncbi:hypothetical protein [Mycobacterium sp. TY815]|uniref:hypothetical protein n=1 Tax=Mycobacterium sp. TY815 TaxID=3050581 RepID=UPI002741374E|nr:hypothetical protein [Mycobacterium sp. TY815]MDP7706792.1 hypothetical protein [Mycobacterium sp. TY815]